MEILSPKTKTGQLLTAALGENAQAETLDELANKLIGKTFAAQIGTSKDGQYARIVHDTISAAPHPAAARDRLEDGGDDAVDFSNIPS